MKREVKQTKYNIQVGTKWKNKQTERETKLNDINNSPTLRSKNNKYKMQQ